MSDVKKPTIPIEVANVIEELRVREYDNAGLISIALRTGGGLHNDTKNDADNSVRHAAGHVG